MTEQRFADAVGVSRGAVQQWERAAGTAPKRANQPLVAKLLGISVPELVSGGPNVVRGRDACAGAAGFRGRSRQLHRHRQLPAACQVLDRVRLGARAAPYLRLAGARRQHGEWNHRFISGRVDHHRGTRVATAARRLRDRGRRQKRNDIQAAHQGRGRTLPEAAESALPDQALGQRPSSVSCASSPSAFARAAGAARAVERLRRRDAAPSGRLLRAVIAVTPR